MQRSIQDLYRYARKSYRKSNEQHWVFARHASEIVGNHERGATLGLAEDMNISVDTVEDHAHAFWMFNKLRNMRGKYTRYFVNSARKLPYIYIAHFRALYDLQESHELTNRQVMSLFLDIVQAEGGISSRNLEDHTHSRFGDTRTWEYYSKRTVKVLGKLLGQPDLPKDKRAHAKKLYDELGGNEK